MKWEEVAKMRREFAEQLGEEVDRRRKAEAVIEAVRAALHDPCNPPEAFHGGVNPSAMDREMIAEVAEAKLAARRLGGSILPTMRGTPAPWEWIPPGGS